jgi:SagB-type dehydrogenase family enzyme
MHYTLTWKRRKEAMERRTFLQRTAMLGMGFWVFIRGVKTWAKGLPSDPGTAAPGGSGPEAMVLPPFEKNSPFTLDRALLDRRTSRSYDPDRTLSREELSRLLWAADGTNRPDGKRTAPSAVAKYAVDILAALPEGVYRYEPKDHKLVRVLSADIRDRIPAQDAFKKAAMQVLYVINKEIVPRGRIDFADLEIGCIGQNLFLEAAALGLGSCIYASVRYDEVTKALGLKDNQILRIAQAVGPIK